jgi:hypothetical protein
MKKSNILDFLSFLPYFAEIYVFIGLQSDDDVLKDQFNGIRIFGLLNLLRLFKLLRLSLHLGEIRIFVQAIQNSKNGILFLLLFWVSSGLFFGNLAYYAGKYMNVECKYVSLLLI